MGVLGRRILDRALKQGTFKTNDGRTITSYVDLHEVFADLWLMYDLRMAVLDKIHHRLAPQHTNTDYHYWIVGVDFGGYPIARELAHAMHIRGYTCYPILCRKQIKEYGAQDRFSPALTPTNMTRVIVTEDVSATRMSISRTCQEVRRVLYRHALQDSQIVCAISVIDRNSKEPRDIMICNKLVPYYSLFWLPEEM